MRSAARKAAFLAFAALSAIGCSLFVDLDGLSDGGSSGVLSDATTSDGPVTTIDGEVVTSDAGPLLQADGGPYLETTVTSVGAVPAATGNAQQRHVFWSESSKLWWVFYIDDVDTSNLKALTSPDFVTWTHASSRGLSTTMALEGRNFSFASKTVGASDYVHVALGHYVGAEELRDAREAIHADAGIDDLEGLTITALAPFVAGVSPDGVSVALGSDGRVLAATGWSTDEGDAGGENVFRSSVAETGGGSGAFNATFANTSPTPSGANPVQNRLLLSQKDGSLLRVWTSTRVTVDADDLLFSTSGADGLSATTPTGIFGSDPTAPVAALAQNDWDACNLDANVALVRRTLDGAASDTYDFTTYSNGSWAKGASIANDPGKLGTGVVTMVVNGTLRVFAIAGDAVNSVRTTKYDGKSWGPWQTIVGTPATRGFLAANGCGDGAHAAIVWTE
ncbi:MAG TPA: hypothetical protein VF407_05280, partial [Polyangiaceae bacterium]